MSTLDAEPALAWTAMPYRSPVLTTEGGEIGSAESLLGDLEEDIFHGIVVRRRGDGRAVEVPAGRVTRVTAKGVQTDLSPADVAALLPYREEHWFHIGWGGLFRKRPEWDQTSNP